MRLDVSQCIGKWRAILEALGIGREHLVNQHGPCPMCGGTDRFRWDDKEGRGTFICNACGAGDGFDLLCAYHGWDSRTAFAEVAKVVGTAEAEKPAEALTDEQRKAALARLWQASRPVERGDPVDEYLRGRGIALDAYPPDLRTCLECPNRETGRAMPAMIARVLEPSGKRAATLHRTWIENGRKAKLAAPRKLMPGGVTDGSAIRLAKPGEVLGIAEGIETALMASQRFGVPCWAAISAPIMRKWEWPPEVKRVVVFGDHDPGFAGQAAAFALAQRVASRHLAVEVRIPGIEIDAEMVGKDWADEVTE